MIREAYIRRYPPREPRKSAANSDELKKLGPDEGVRELSGPPVEAEHFGVPDKKGDDGCHLWTLEGTDFPYILERAEVAPSLESGLVKHTNLTGGAPASCGGEFWVDPDDSSVVYVNGCSGRYGPTSAEQLEDLVKVLEQEGLTVKSFGWDEEAGLPAQVLR